MGKSNWGAGVSGGASAAMTGAGLFGVPGAVTLGAAGFVSGLFGGGRKKKKKRSAYDKKQQQLNDYEHEAIMGEGPLADLYNYDPEAANDVFEKTIANPAYRNFQEKLAPEITGQFRNQGLMNSSYVGDALAKSGRDIQEGLDAQRTAYLYGEQKDARNAKRNAIQDVQGRTTFDYDTSNQGGGFNLDDILSKITPEKADDFKKWVSSFSSGKGGVK